MYFSKNRNLEKPDNLFVMVSNWLKGTSEKTSSWVYLLVKFNSKNSRERYCSTVAGTIVQRSLAQLFNNHWHNCSTVTGKIVQQSLERLFNSLWYDCSTITSTVLQLLLARLEFFNSDVHYWRIVPCNRNATHDTDQFAVINLSYIFHVFIAGVM